MLKWLGSLVDSNEKELKKLRPLVEDINSLETDITELSAAALRAKTDEFKARLKDDESLDDLLPEAFAVAREAARRAIEQRHFDVQLMGGIVLHRGRIAEMRTGEGKTLVATLPLYLNALTGQGCHLVTVNDYLARRDAYWMGPIYHSLGLTVASIYGQTPDNQAPSYLYDPDYDSGDTRWRHFRPVARRQAYEADITYGTNNEFGFDYLRDNMVTDLSQCVQRAVNYAIVDEVDNILIDEARTPLIISGQAEESAKTYFTFAKLVPQLRQGPDFTIEEKERRVKLTDDGMSRVEDMLAQSGILKGLSLYDPVNHGLTHYLENALQAQFIFKRDKDYVLKEVKDSGKVEKQVLIVDEFTGRLMFGRRYSEGLHQAIEAKEGVRIQPETTTMATITFQNYFRLYKKLAGMTGTAATEAEEMHKIYKLEVVTIPTNKPMIRTDNPDRVYKTEDGKYKAAAKEIEELWRAERPVLVGTVSIEKSERLSELLKRQGVPHNILNAKNHEKEAGIIADAGKPGMVTVATNMAGRGVDIILGGQEKTVSPHEEVEAYLKELLPDFAGGAADNDAFYPLCVESLQKLKAKSEENRKWLQQSDKAAQATDVSIATATAAGKEAEDRRSWVEKYEKCNQWVEDYKKHREWQADRDKVLEKGGLHVLGTERHEARRIDNQLRGRSGRQGDPGSSRFYVSLEDDIMRRFGGDRLQTLMQWAGMDETTPIEHSLVSKAIENAQVKVEGYHFDMRKHLVDYDDVVNKHREVVYAERKKILSGADLKANILSMLEKHIQSQVEASWRNGQEEEQANLEALWQELSNMMPMPASGSKDFSGMTRDELQEKLIQMAEALYEEREKNMGPEVARVIERLVMLRAVDTQWIDHLTEMERLRQGIGLRAVAQIDPLVVYKKEGHAYFQSLLANIEHEVTHTIFRVEVARQGNPNVKASPMAKQAKQREAAAVGATKTVGRNDPCPCGSGKKYKKCCGQ